MPDSSIGPAERDAYGYTAEDMLPLNAERAVELFNQDLTIYLLHTENTESMAFDSDEIITFCSGGICGITRADWQNSKEYKALGALPDFLGVEKAPEHTVFDADRSTPAAKALPSEIPDSKAEQRRVSASRETEKEKPSLMAALKAGAERSRREFGDRPHTPQKSIQREEL
jgi:hypothetical protein